MEGLAGGMTDGEMGRLGGEGDYLKIRDVIIPFGFGMCRGGNELKRTCSTKEF